jgi:hypothetical protein
MVPRYWEGKEGDSELVEEKVEGFERMAEVRRARSNPNYHLPGHHPLERVDPDRNWDR